MTLELYRHGQLAPSREWVNLNPEERRRRAVAAAGGDVGTLLDLLEAHHVRTHGHVSGETLRKYRLAARTWLEYAQGSAVRVLHPETEHADLWVRELEAGGKSPASVGVLLAGARALYSALRWARATTDHPFTDVNPRRAFLTSASMRCGTRRELDWCGQVFSFRTWPNIWSTVMCRRARRYGKWADDRLKEYMRRA